MVQDIEAHWWYNRCTENSKNRAKALHLEGGYSCVIEAHVRRVVEYRSTLEIAHFQRVSKLVTQDIKHLISHEIRCFSAHRCGRRPRGFSMPPGRTESRANPERRGRYVLAFSTECATIKLDLARNTKAAFAVKKFTEKGDAEQWNGR